MTRRLRIYWFSAAIIVEIFKGERADGVRCLNPIPKDARLHGTHTPMVDGSRFPERVGFIVESEEFDEVLEGALIPEAALMFEKVPS